MSEGASALLSGSCGQALSISGPACVAISGGVDMGDPEVDAVSGSLF